MNCGCGQPHEDHGKPENITAAALERAGDANGQSLRESSQHIVEAVELLDASRRDDPGRGLAEPAGPGGAGATNAGARGTPATES
ncbi:MAG TPA: hypothetical protein VM451_02475 [Candidatus Limnocylindria bacterium]|nr:hypothetical protein [Candidatus Limnocylindria bacterium]